jgi:hypothetical protein
MSIQCYFAIGGRVKIFYFFRGKLDRFAVGRKGDPVDRAIPVCSQDHRRPGFGRELRQAIKVVDLAVCFDGENCSALPSGRNAGRLKLSSPEVSCVGSPPDAETLKSAELVVE